MTERNATETETAPDFSQLTADLERMLKLRAIPFGMKLFESAKEMESIPKIRRPQAVHTLDQIVAQCARLGWTVGVRGEDLVGDQCRSVVGLGGQDKQWFSGQKMVGVWYATLEDAGKHQSAMNLVPNGRYEALVVAPLSKWGKKEGSTRSPLDAPDIVLFYATPGAMIYFINGLQWTGYKRFDWSVVGESSCADSWGRALRTREPSLSLPCFGERRYGGVLDEEMLMALPHEHMIKAMEGMQALAKNGLRYPIPQYGVQQDVRAGLGVSYPKR
jgi:uncharacterized protein (DUF169 family)